MPRRPKPSPPPAPPPSPSVRVRVPASKLLRSSAAARAHAPLSSPLHAARAALTPPRRVCVAARAHAQPASVLYASRAPASPRGTRARHPYSETQFVAVAPRARDAALVRANHAFELRVLGLSAAPHDVLAGDLELLLYSLQSRAQPNRRDDDAGDAVPTVHVDPGDVPRAPPDSFIPVPARKTLFLAHNPADAEAAARREVYARFHLLEIDQVSETAQSAISGIGQLGTFALQFATTIPPAGLLSPALELASSVGRHALNSFAKPDRVLVTDFRFLLAPPDEGLDAGGDDDGHDDDDNEQDALMDTGDYLRYGYYFFLSRPVDFKLYASTGVSSQNVSLMLKRVDKWSDDESEFFPLTGVSYLVMEVTRVSGDTMAPMRKPVKVDHAQRIHQLLQQSRAPQDEVSASEIVRNLKKLASDLGVTP